MLLIRKCPLAFMYIYHHHQFPGICYDWEHFLYIDRYIVSMSTILNHQLDIFRPVHLVYYTVDIHGEKICEWAA